jgi:hypothetical protein
MGIKKILEEEDNTQEKGEGIHHPRMGSTFRQRWSSANSFFLFTISNDVSSLIPKKENTERSFIK